MITVYLDSSDYSIMADPRRTEASNIYEFLKAKVEDSSIEIRLSALNVLEGAHVDSGSKSMAVQRTEVMQTLSRGKCFVWWSKLISNETLNVGLTDTATGSAPITNDDGHWFPNMTGMVDNLKVLTEKSLKNGLSELQMGRNQRRQMKTRLMRNGRFTREGMELLEKNRGHALTEIRKQFPLPQRAFDEDIVFRTMTGELPMRALEDVLHEAFRDLPTFVGWAYDQYDKDRKLTSWLRTGTITEAVAEFRKSIDRLLEVGANTPTLDIDRLLELLKSKKLPETRTKLLWAIYDEIQGIWKDRGFKRSDWQSRTIETAIGNIPSIDTMLQIAFNYVVHNVRLTPYPRKLRTSDYGDILHTLYMPHVDIFRCDGYMAEIADATAAKYDTTVVSKIVDLPTAIKSLT